MPPEIRSRSPDGRYQVVVNPWEARNSLWVDSPSVVEAATGCVVLRFGDARWSLDGAEWISDDEVELVLRKYPGNHTPVDLRVTVDLAAGTARLDPGSPVTLGELEAALERRLAWS